MKLSVGAAIFALGASVTSSKHCSDSPYGTDPGQKSMSLTFTGGLKVSGAEDTPVIWAEQLSSIPHIKSDSLENDLYMIFMEDPDAPTPEKPQKHSWKHWVKFNVPADNLGGGENRLPYAPPTPPKSSPPHRYYVAIYKQAQGVATIEDFPADTQDHGAWDSANTFSKLKIDYKFPVAWICFKATSKQDDVLPATPKEDVSHEDAQKAIDEAEKEAPEEAKAAKEEIAAEAAIKPHSG